MSTSTVLSFVIIVVVSGLLLTRHFWTPSTTLVDIPHNKYPLWHIFGDIPSMLRASTPVDYFSQHVRKHGSISQSRTQSKCHPFSRNHCHLMPPREIEENLQRRSEDFDKAAAVRAAFAGTLPEGSVGLPADAQWKLHRRMMAPSMSPAYLATKMTLISANARKLIDIWALKSDLVEDRPGVFQCDDDIERFAMDTIMTVLFGDNLDCLQTTYNYIRGLDQTAFNALRGPLGLSVPSPAVYQSIRTLLKGMGSALQSGAPRLVYWRFSLSPAWRAARRASYGFIDDKLKEHAREPSTHESFLAQLSARYSTGRPEAVKLSAFKDEIMTYIIVQIRLHGELSTFFPLSDNLSISYEDINGVERDKHEEKREGGNSQEYAEENSDQGNEKWSRRVAAASRGPRGSSMGDTSELLTMVGDGAFGRIVYMSGDWDPRHAAGAGISLRPAAFRCQVTANIRIAADSAARLHTLSYMMCHIVIRALPNAFYASITGFGVGADSPSRRNPIWHRRQPAYGLLSARTSKYERCIRTYWSKVILQMKSAASRRQEAGFARVGGIEKILAQWDSGALPSVPNWVTTARTSRTIRPDPKSGGPPSKVDVVSSVSATRRRASPPVVTYCPLFFCLAVGVENWTVLPALLVIQAEL
ncbi:cytochrome P450 [Mycena pura]|uniref:Cytochrome P450 n=1 Tax=Mycena pura TaxID=153505 RepID=A0AAD6YCA4_9AGAR|nr:cytochrome P450 [Mycena pura]